MSLLENPMALRHLPEQAEARRSLTNPSVLAETTTRSKTSLRVSRSKLVPFCRRTPDA